MEPPQTGPPQSDDGRAIPPSLLTQLCAEYPELSGRAVAEALEHANRASSLLGGATDGSRGRIRSLARDRLEVLRIRAAAAARRAGVTAAATYEMFNAGRVTPLGAAAVAGAPATALIDESRFDRLARLVRADSGAPDIAVSADSLCRTAVERLGAGAVAVSVPDGLSTAQTIGVHGVLARRVEELQVTVGEGPSLDGLRTAGTILVDDVDAADQQARWPVFGPAAADAGVQSLCVLPMHVGAARFGVLVLYFDRVGGLSAAGLAEARTFAAIALELLLDHAGPAGREVDSDPSRDRRFFDDRPEIHQATGMVSVQLGVDVGTALLRLRARAYADGRLLSEAAADVVARTLYFDERAEL